MTSKVEALIAAPIVPSNSIRSKGRVTPGLGRYSNCEPTATQRSGPNGASGACRTETGPSQRSSSHAVNAPDVAVAMLTGDAPGAAS